MVSTRKKGAILRGKEWARQLPKLKREWLAWNIRRHRKLFFDYGIGFESYRGGAYVRNRSVKSLRQFPIYVVDILSFIESKLPARKRLKVLDSGAGYLGVAKGLKENFGRRVFVTALNPTGIMVFLKKEAEFRRAIGETKDPVLRNDMQQQFNDLKKAGIFVKYLRKNPAEGEYRVGAIETFSTRRKYGVILDFHGPIEHSMRLERVFQQYFLLLEPKGSIIASFGLLKAREIGGIVKGHFGKESGAARRYGFFLEMRQYPGSNVFEIQKLPLK